MSWRHDESQRLESAFVMSAEQRGAFRRCPEVVLFDATFKTNRFGMALMVATAVNEERQFVPVAFAVLQGETVREFEWFFTAFTAAVGDDTVPRINVVMTDGCGDSRFASTVARFFPQSAHH